MKQPVKAAGFHKKNVETKDSQVHPIVRWWPIQTPRLTGQPFKNPVAEIPSAQSPLKPREQGI
jgi:hypothetical protein